MVDTFKRELMQNAPLDPSALLPLTPAVFHILLALADGEHHGYEIMQAIATRSGTMIPIGPGTLYGAIKRLLATGLIVESGERPDPMLDDQRRRYYRLTDFGQHVLRAEAQRLAHLVDLARAKRLLSDAEFAPAGRTP
jgi:DNA-binding PadR family transcriptional regulator